MLSQRWCLRWLQPHMEDRLFRWIPAAARTDLIRVLAEARRRRWNIWRPGADLALCGVQSLAEALELIEADQLEPATA